MTDGQPASGGIWEFVRACARLVTPGWRKIMAVLVAMSPGVAYTAGYPLILRALIDNAILPGQGAVAVTLIAALVGLLLLSWVGDVLHQYLVARLVADVGKALRLRVFQHVQDLQVRAYERFEGGDILSRCITSTEAIEQALTLLFSSLLAQVLTIAVGSAILVLIEWRLAALCLLLMPFVYIGPRLFGRRVEQASLVRQSDAARLVGVVQENIAVQLVVKAFGLRDVARQRFQDHLEHYWHSSVRFGFLSSLLGSTLWRSGAVLLVVCLSVGSVLALQGQLSVGALVAFFELLWWMVAAFQSLADAIPPFQTAATAQRRLDELLSQPIESASVSTAHQAAPLERQVCFEEVSFQYDDGVPALERVTLTLPANASIAVVGPSGSGKSTLLSMLLHFYEPSSGRVTMDGLELCAATAGVDARADWCGSFKRVSSLTPRYARTSDWVGSRRAMRILNKPPGQPSCMTRSWTCRTDTTPGLASAAGISRAASASDWRSLGLSSESRGCFCSMRPPRHLTRSLRPRLAQRWIGWLATARSSPRRTGLRRSPAMTGSLS